jgi:hypothetical protein
MHRLYTAREQMTLAMVMRLRRACLLARHSIMLTRMLFMLMVSRILFVDVRTWLTVDVSYLPELLEEDVDGVG